MSYGMNLKPEGALDLLALGALVHRLDPGIIPFRKAAHCDIYVSGGEYNVAANLSNCFGLKTGIATAMVRYPIGDLIAEQVRAMGVRPFYKVFDHNGVSGPNMATVYSDRGQGVRAPVVFYNRANEAGAQLKPGDFDWDKIFAGGVRWFHSGGIFAALSDTTGPLIIEGMQAAKAQGAIVSFDFNYRAKLWESHGGKEAASQVFTSIVKNTDVIIGGVDDLQMGLGVTGAQTPSENGLDPSVFLGTIETVIARYPHIKVIATDLRVVHSTNRHTWSAIAWINGKAYQAPACDLDVLDRVGSGDGFSSGLFYGLLTGASEQEAVNLGWAHGALLTTYPGDTTMATLEQVREFALGGSARIQR